MPPTLIIRCATDAKPAALEIQAPVWAGLAYFRRLLHRLAVSPGAIFVLMDSPDIALEGAQCLVLEHRNDLQQPRIVYAPGSETVTWSMNSFQWNNSVGLCETFQEDGAAQRQYLHSYVTDWTVELSYGFPAA